MSVYCLGKLKGRHGEYRSFLQAAAKSAGLGLSFDIDPDDENVLNEPKDLAGDGVTFAVFSEPGHSDVVTAWNTARDVGLARLRAWSAGSELPDCRTTLDDFDLPEPVRRELAGTSLGRFVSQVLGFEELSAGGLTLFDGSVRQILPGTREWCLRRILTGFLIPWDCGPDALYIWNQGNVRS